MSVEFAHSAAVGDGGYDETGPEPSASRRTACTICRKRKLRCDGAAPSCGRCARLGHQCSYDESKRTVLPRRGHVKSLETRISQVETMLKNLETDDSPETAPPPAAFHTIWSGTQSESQWTNISNEPNSLITPNELSTPDAVVHFDYFSDSAATNPVDEMQDDKLSWEIIELGLDEPLPLQDVLEELTHIYFTKVHPWVPIIQKARFMAAMNLSPQARPPIALRYAIWTLAVSITTKYRSLLDHFYARARKYADSTEAIGHGEKVTCTPYAQAQILIGLYEFKMMHFPRAWLRTGKAIRLAQMMVMHRLDGDGMQISQCLLPPRDTAEKEERRRTFWMAYCMDRYATIGSGWPMTIDERDIMTNLPCSEEMYEQGRESPSMSLGDAMNPLNVTEMSPFAGVVVVASFFGKVLTHLHRPGPDDRDDDLNGDFWKRHRSIDTTLLTTCICLPPHLKVFNGVPTPNTIFLNLCLHAATICLHQAAIFKAEKYQLSANIIGESKMRCLTAASEVGTILRMIAHMDLATMNPFTPFCIFVATRTFIEYFKMQPGDEKVKSSIQFLLYAMAVMKDTNPMADSFLVQLEAELQGTGVETPPRYPQFHVATSPEDPMDGSPWLHIVSPLVDIAD